MLTPISIYRCFYGLSEFNGLSEADEFLHSEDMDNNPSQPSNLMISGRPKTELEPIRKCIDQDYLKTLHEKYFGTFPGNDYQLNYAFEVIGCVPN